jgi:myo-inositol-1-phosphate synthase
MSTFRVGEQPKRVGVLIVGLAGNNGSSLWALHKLNPKRVFGSLLSCSNVQTAAGENVNLCDLMQEKNMLSTLGNVIAIEGWDAVDTSLLQALRANKVVDEKSILELLDKYPREMQRPIPKGIVYPAFIGLPVAEHTEGSVAKDVVRISKDIEHFAKIHVLDFVIVMYSGSTERKAVNPDFADFQKILFAEDDDVKIATNSEVSASQVYAIATALTETNASFVNCAAQDTLVPFVKGLFKNYGRLCIGNDLSTGQTRLKSALLGTFLANGIPMETIVNFNTLGNNDGLNLMSMGTNRSKIQSKCAMVDGAMANAPTLYEEQKLDIDQLVSICYLKTAGDNKRAMDEYSMLLPFNQHLQMFITSICPDTSLALGVLVDLILSVTLMSTITVFREIDILDLMFDQLISSNKANALLACFVKHPQSKVARFLLHENRDILTGFVLEACGKVPETYRHRRLLTKKSKKVDMPLPI